MSRNPTKQDVYEAKAKIHLTTAILNYHVELFGDELAEREKYKNLSGLDAVRFYLIQKHHWLPRDVNAMSYEELRFVLQEEMSSWTPPEEARVQPRLF